MKREQQITNRVVQMLSAILLATALAGCAGQPMKDASGRTIVWVSAVNRDTSAGKQSGLGAVFGQVAGVFGAGIAGQAVADAAGRGVGKATAGEPQPGKIHVMYYHRKPSKSSIAFGPPSQWREAWPGSEYLFPNTWAIMSHDDKGPIFLPCDDACRPPTDDS